ncbi:MAG: type II toxin-antitoxin system VapC family toxin [Actinomycetia bacterium]|nr:type II toxin-antitoxin system VapC family toxin [Actinomycetes bacterium]
MTTVLDASAVLSLILGEPGSAVVARHLPDGCMSSVNYAETLGRLVLAGMPSERAHWIVERLQIRIVDFTSQQARVAADLHPRLQGLGLSLGDRACLSLATLLDAPVVTADRIWADADVDVEILVIR